MRATFKLINSYFWKTYYGPIMTFTFPIILLGILGNIFRIEYVYPGIIAMSFLFIGLLSLPLTIMELKQSSLFKYIGSSPVNPIKFTLVVIGFYVFISLIVAVIILLTTLILFHSKAFPSSGFRNGVMGGIFTLVGSFSFIVSILLHLGFVIIIGILISTISKTPQQALTIGLIVLIPSIFLSGMIISVDIIATSPVLNWISRFIPFRYTTGNIIIATTPKDQLGDIIEQLPYDEKILIFKDEYVTPNGTILIDQVPNLKDPNDPNKEFEVHTLGDLKYAINYLNSNVSGGNINQYLSNEKLFELTISKILNRGSAAADNNIFNWKDSWSVRRIPKIEVVKKFIQEYFLSYKTDSGGEADFSNLKDIGEQIALGKFGWLNIFLKQTNELYYPAERCLNILLPITASGLATWYIWTNFNWSSR